MKYVLVKNDIVRAKKVSPQEGYIEAPDDVKIGSAYDGVDFYAPPSPYHAWDGSNWVLDNQQKHDALQQSLADYRWQQETDAITINSKPVPTDRHSQIKWQQQKEKSENDSTYSVRWKMADGQFYSLDASEIISIADAVATHVDNCFAVEDTVQQEIQNDQHTTEQQVQTRFEELL